MLKSVKLRIIDKATGISVNNEKMMIDNPEDPLNRMPNWGNRYWKSLTEAREALGIDKHTSMRDMIQSDYAAMAKAVNSAEYNKTQIQLYVLDKDVRGLFDSMDVQKEQFATQSKDIVLKESNNVKTDEKTVENPENKDRWRICIQQEDEREKMKSEPKVFSNLVIEKASELTFDATKGNNR